MTLFEQSFQVVVGVEGGLSTNPLDPGNWTGGRCREGVCNGTKFGISAASYPTLNIAQLSLTDAQKIYRDDFWDKARADDLPPALAVLLFDAAVNSGLSRAIRWLQLAVNVAQDGIVGPVTIQAARQATGHGATVIAEFQAQRLLFLTTLPTWRVFGLGWARRVCTIQLQALRIGEATR